MGVEVNMVRFCYYNYHRQNNNIFFYNVINIFIAEEIKVADTHQFTFNGKQKYMLNEVLKSSCLFIALITLHILCFTKRSFCNKF